MKSAKAPPTNSDFCDISEASVLTGWERATLYSKSSRREIPSYRIGRSLRFKRSDLLKLFKPRPALQPLAEKEGGES